MILDQVAPDLTISHILQINIFPFGYNICFPRIHKFLSQYSIFYDFTDVTCKIKRKQKTNQKKNRKNRMHILWNILCRVYGYIQGNLQKSNMEAIITSATFRGRYLIYKKHISVVITSHWWYLHVFHHVSQLWRHKFIWQYVITKLMIMIHCTVSLHHLGEKHYIKYFSWMIFYIVPKSGQRRKLCGPRLRGIARWTK